MEIKANLERSRSPDMGKEPVAEPHTIWVEVDIKEDDDGTVVFSGLVDRHDLEALIKGEFQHDFLKLDQVFWVNTNNSDEAWKPDERQVFHYGYGKHSNYRGDLYVKKERIIEISPLKGGPEFAELTDP